MFGHRIGTVVSIVAMWSLVLLAIFVWPGLPSRAIPIFFIADTAVPPLNDLTPLTAGRAGLGYASLAILLLILMPVPDCTDHRGRIGHIQHWASVLGRA